jgi:hypothetical protein
VLVVGKKDRTTGFDGVTGRAHCRGHQARGYPEPPNADIAPCGRYVCLAYK